ncbi:oxygen-independent coproporphyrinogen III oxidase [Gaetbulibacter aestuarii]|uniref:Coproporphyrinogen-III oxidase n=1 Tax=Gaetbulibacter aestuarii TaxID=1502358 RepID=A0ABW7MXD4_9FLAO
MCYTLVNKYNVPGPRYTSYPTVPYWNADDFSLKDWKSSVLKAFSDSDLEAGISLYIHLPFCESLCTFCGCHKRITKKHDVERPYIHAILREWDLYLKLLPQKPLIKALHIGGGTPTFFSPKNLHYLITGILKRAMVADEHEFSFEGHPNNTTKEHLQTLFDLGFRRVSFGVQDYNETVQHAIHRIQTFEQVAYVTKTAREMGYTSVGHDLIFGLPRQTLEHVQETIEKTKQLKPDRIAFYSYAHVPWRKGNGQRGFGDADVPKGQEKLEQYTAGKKALIAAGYHDIGMDHFALLQDTLYKAFETNQLHRNFMGYTEVRTKLMIGLGASAISDSWYAFAQNVKGVEEYMHLLNNNIFPVYRGHILNEEDLVIRKHILNLMCTFKTSWSDEEDWFEALPNVLSRFEEMEHDDLVKIDSNALEVTDKGKPFIRNICMAFDLLLNRKQPETKLFSMTV